MCYTELVELPKQSQTVFMFCVIKYIHVHVHEITNRGVSQAKRSEKHAKYSTHSKHTVLNVGCNKRNQLMRKKTKKRKRTSFQIQFSRT